METVVAALSAAWFVISQATRLPLQLAGRESTVDVAFEMSDGGLLAGDHMFHQVADGDHAHDLVSIEDRQVANMLIRH